MKQKFFKAHCVLTILFVMACSQIEYISQKEDQNININEQYNQFTNTLPLAEDIIKTSAFLWSGWVSNGKVLDQNISMDEKCESIYPESHLKDTLDHLSEADMKNMVLRHKAFLVKDPSNHLMHESFGVPDHFSLRGPEGYLITNEYPDFFDPAFSLDSTLNDAEVFTDTPVSYSDTIFDGSFKDPYWLGYKLENDTLKTSSGNELCNFWKEDKAINSTSSNGTLGNGNGASAGHRFALMSKTPNSSQASKQARGIYNCNILAWGKYSLLGTDKAQAVRFRSKIDNFILSGSNKLKKQLRTLKSLGIEKDLFEYRASNQEAFFVFHYGIAHRFVRGVSTGIYGKIEYLPHFMPTWETRGSYNYTVGLEWTPKGYKVFINGRPQDIYRGKPHLKDANGFYMEAISHAAEFITISIASRNTFSEARHAAIDYIRVYQLKNKYSDITPKSICLKYSFYSNDSAQYIS